MIVLRRIAHNRSLHLNPNGQMHTVATCPAYRS